VCHMAGTMKFSEVPPYPYTCRSLHRVRTGKMRTKSPFAAYAKSDGQIEILRFSERKTVFRYTVRERQWCASTVLRCERSIHAAVTKDPKVIAR